MSSRLSIFRALSLSLSFLLLLFFSFSPSPFPSLLYFYLSLSLCSSFSFFFSSYAGQRDAVLVARGKVHGQEALVGTRKLLLAQEQVVAPAPQVPVLVHLADHLVRLHVRHGDAAAEKVERPRHAHDRLALDVQDQRRERPVRAQQLPLEH